MFLAIDKKTNQYVLSIKLRYHNYKDTYNYKLKFRCADNNCKDENIIFVNGLYITPHFRHSSNKYNCSISKEFKNFNNPFCYNWFMLFKDEYRKPYWFNKQLEDINIDDKTILIRYYYQKPEIIYLNEKNCNKINKIIWILSLEKRKYNKIYHYKGKIYIDFTGNKNDIPLFNSNKSNVYLDTGTNYLLKVLLDSYNYCGQEIEIVDIYNFCKNIEELFIAYPYRKKSEDLSKLIKEKENYVNSEIYNQYLIDNIIINHYDFYYDNLYFLIIYELYELLNTKNILFEEKNKINQTLENIYLGSYKNKLDVEELFRKLYNKKSNYKILYPLNILEYANLNYFNFFWSFHFIIEKHYKKFLKLL